MGRTAPRRSRSAQSYTSPHAVGDVLRAWLEHNEASYTPASLRDQNSCVRLVGADPIAKVAVARLAVANVDRWVSGLRRAGIGDSAIHNRLVVLRAALQQAMVWGWITTNPAALAQFTRVKRPPLDAMAPEDAIAVIKAAADIDPLAGRALRVAAVAGARRAETAALRWADLRGSVLTVDSSVHTVRDGDATTLIDSRTKTAERHTVTLDRDGAPVGQAPGHARGLRGRTCSTSVTARRARTGSDGGGTGPGPRSPSTRGGGSTTCVISQPRWRPEAGTTYARWLIGSATPTRQ